MIAHRRNSVLLFIGLAIVSCSGQAEFRAEPDSYTTRTARIGNDTVLHTIAQVDTSFFGVTEPLLGRSFSAADHADSTSNAILLSHEFWSNQFDRRPDIIGTALQVDGVEHIIVGIMPQYLDVPEGVALWLPRSS